VVFCRSMITNGIEWSVTWLAIEFKVYQSKRIGIASCPVSTEISSGDLNVKLTPVQISQRVRHSLERKTHFRYHIRSSATRACGIAKAVAKACSYKGEIILSRFLCRRPKVIYSINI
jgi:hypothetical protein